MMEIRNLQLPYGLSRSVSFSAQNGECLLLAGPNGCGKTTLLKSLAAEGNGVLIPTGIPKLKGFTVEEFIRTGCYRESNWAGKLTESAAQRMTAALSLLGLSGLRGQDISTLSDGAFQKATIAIGLSRKAEVLLLDEPTAYLDVDGRLMVLQALRDAARESGRTVIFSSHDLHDALAVAARVLAFTPDGRFLESGPGNREAVLREAFPRYRP